MKKILYIRIRKPVQITGLNPLRKAADKILGKYNEISFECTDIFDERLVNTGVILTYYGGDSGELSGIITQVAEICDCGKTAFEDYSVKDFAGISGFDGTEEILRSELERFIDDRDSFVGVILPAEDCSSYVRIISDTFRYLILYSKDRSVSYMSGEMLASYNGTSAVVTDRVQSLAVCDIIINLDKKSRNESLPASAAVITPYRLFSEQPEGILFSAYSDKFEPIKLSAAFREAFFAE